MAIRTTFLIIVDREDIMISPPKSYTEAVAWDGPARRSPPKTLVCGGTQNANFATPIKELRRRVAEGFVADAGNALKVLVVG